MEMQMNWQKNLVAALVLLVAASAHAQDTAPQTTTTPAPGTASAEPAAPIDMTPWEGVSTRSLMGRRCVNEGTWNRVDCALITHIAVRNARYSGTDLRTWLIQHHGTRSLHPERHIPALDGRGREAPRLVIRVRRDSRVVELRDDRPWIGDLSDDMHQPSMWSWRNNMSWDRSGSRRWAEILEVVDGVFAGTEPDPSGGRARIWGGPQIDADAIAQRLRQGYVLIDIPGADNHYFARP